MRPTRLQLVLLAVAGLAILIAGIGIALTRPTRPTDAVRQRIEASTSCDDLQGEFDAADARRKAALNHGDTELAETNLSYMEAAEERRQDLGCP